MRNKFLEQIIKRTAKAVAPPERLAVWESAEKYRYIRNVGSYVGPWRQDLVPYTTEVYEELLSLEKQGVVFVTSVQSSKALYVETPIFTPSGWKRFGDLKEGDYVFGTDGKPTKIVAVSRKRMQECYAVGFSRSEEEIIASHDHRWTVRLVDTDTPKRHTLTTAELYERRKLKGVKAGRAYARIDVAAPLELPHRELPIPPYLMGFFLGDGQRHKGYITSGDEDLKDTLRAFNALDGVRAISRAWPNRSHDIRVSVAGVSLYKLLLTYDFVGKGKYIPEEYLHASTKQRQELLRGLMDSDGHRCPGNQCTFTQNTGELATQTLGLIRSLGYKANSTQRPTKLHGRVVGEALNIRFSDVRQEVFGLERKKRKELGVKLRPSHVKTHFINSIKPVGRRETMCIAVEAPDHLFCVGRTHIPTHNTEVGLNFALHSVVSDPSDFMTICPTMVSGRDFSMRRIDKMIRDCVEVRDQISSGRYDNVFDKRFIAGNMWTVSWPTIAELSGKPVPRIHISDYDRCPPDIGGEGNAFDLAMKRTTSFKRRGMLLAESTPGFEITDPKWKGDTPHEMPPAPGIIELFNRGDRRKWYWVCQHCEEAFQPTLENLNIPDEGDHITRGENARVVCPHCGSVYSEDDRKDLNNSGLWIPDLCHYDAKTKEVVGTPVKSDIASFWMSGLAAAFGSWRSMVAELLRAQENYEKTGDENPLKVCLNTSFGLPFLPKHLESLRTPDELMEGANDIGKHIVPEGVAFLAASIDIQKRRFVVQVHGHYPNGDIAVIDRFDIFKGYRRDEDGDRAPVRPGSYPEDWGILVKEVILKEYAMAGEGERYMGIKKTMCDSGGLAGTTANALKFCRWLSREPSEDVQRLTGWEPGLRPRFMLLRGSASKVGARVQVTYPDSTRKDRHSGARGDVAVALLNVQILKDNLDGILDREEEGGGKILFADWLPQAFYDELCVEVKDPQKGWVNPLSKRNESWDLLVYTLAARLLPGMNTEVIDWEAPPSWADPESKNNPYVREVKEEVKEVEEEKTIEEKLEDLGDLLT